MDLPAGSGAEAGIPVDCSIVAVRAERIQRKFIRKSNGDQVSIEPACRLVHNTWKYSAKGNTTRGLFCPDVRLPIDF
jgi:hypothetical protein